MKENFGMFGLPRWGVGAIVLTLCAFTPVSRADVVINNLGDSIAAHELNSGDPLAQVFTITASSAGDLSTLTLQLYSTAGGTANVYLYNTSSDVPTGSAIATLGSVTAGTSGSQQVAVDAGGGSVNPYNLTAGTYAIVLGTGSLAWDSTITTASGSGSLPSDMLYYNGTSWLSQDTAFGQMLLSTVPEVPMTGMVMGFGGLAIALGHTLRRKLHPATSSIA
jgi:hypothetical protein